MSTQFLWGALCVASLMAGCFFLRFWFSVRDRLFLVFALAFGTLALNWMLLAVVQPKQESRHLIYLVRLVAFLLIVGGILDKNRRK